MDRSTALPLAGASWPELEAWCATLAGPEGDPRPIDELAAIARHVEAAPELASDADLLAACFFWQRRARWNGEGGEGEDAVLIRAALEQLRRRAGAERPA